MSAIRLYQLACLVFAVSVALITSCSKEEAGFYAEDVPLIAEATEFTAPLEILPNIGKVNINVIATANYRGDFNNAFLKNISGTGHSYCHPDVEYFPDGFNGYRFWMAFTPYFGLVGTDQLAKRYENPTIVVSNDGLNWISPVGIKSPIQETPSLEESFIDQKNEPKQGFWSDVDLLYLKNKFNLFTRGSFITAEALKNRGAGSRNNKEKLKKNAQRTIIRQTSSDGIHWNPLEVVLTSNMPYTPQNSHLVSPTFIHNGKDFISYEVEINTGPKNYKGPDKSYIIQRASKDGFNYPAFNKSKIVNFINKPWAKVNPNYAPWHIQAEYVDGFYFLCLAVGDVTRYSSESIYIAFSKDGLNFKVIPYPLVERKAYRSAIFKMSTDESEIHFGAMLGFKNGEFQFREFKLSKERLIDSLK